MGSRQAAVGPEDSALARVSCTQWPESQSVSEPEPEPASLWAPQTPSRSLSARTRS